MKSIICLWTWTTSLILFSNAVISVAFCQYKTEVGYDRLISELSGLGSSIPTGVGVRVGIVEANFGNFDYFPDASNSEFAGKTLTNRSTDFTTNPKTSNHATTVGQFFFGNSVSMSGGISQVDVYDASNFVSTRQRLGTTSNPDPTSFSVVNHSYIGGIDSTSAQANARLDYTINRDRFTSVAALNNGPGPVPGIYGQSYNSIIVGLTNGSHSYGDTTIGLIGRYKPDIVAPAGFTSFSTPMISSAAAMLHSAASQLNMANARAPEAMKAIILAGADKSPFSSWSNSSAHPLDRIYGVGELDVYNSHRILRGGESNGSLSALAAASGPYGWDLGNVSTNSTQYWNINVANQSDASIVLTWNATYADTSGNFSLDSFSLADMSLSLFTSNQSGLGSLIYTSNSAVDNVEHIYLRNLSAGQYTIGVVSNRSADFGLAWSFTAVPEPSSFTMIGVVTLFMAGKRLRRKGKFQAS